MSLKPKVLIADDDSLLLRTAELILSKNYQTYSASSIPSAKGLVGAHEIEVVVVDLNFEGHEEDGLDLAKWLIDKHPDISIIVLSGDACTERVVGAATLEGVVQFIPKSRDYATELATAVGRGVERRRLLLEEKSKAPTFATNSPLMIELLKEIEHVLQSSSNSPILITGESGTGKEIMVKYIAGRLKKKLVATNMASIPQHTAESELFGHKKGAFTGATYDKAGLIEQAHQGIFFLDELGECSLAIQTKLLRVIQEGELQPVGAVGPKRIVTRFMGATNRDLDAMVAEGAFRLDLLERLNTFQFELPPLRKRPEDVILYTYRFLETFGGDQKIHLTESAKDLLLSYSWPGNVRELRNVIEKAVVYNSLSVIDADVVSRTLGNKAPKRGLISGAVGGPSRRKIERAELLRVLEATGNNRSETARLLGVSYMTVLRTMEAYGLMESNPGIPGRKRKAGSS